MYQKLNRRPFNRHLIRDDVAFYHFCRIRVPDGAPFIAYLQAPVDMVSTALPFTQFSASTGITIFTLPSFSGPYLLLPEPHQQTNQPR